MCLFCFLFLSKHSGGTDFLCSVFIISPFLKQKPKYFDKWESLVNRPFYIRAQNHKSHCILIVHFSWSHHHHDSISSYIKGYDNTKYNVTPMHTYMEPKWLYNTCKQEGLRNAQKTAVLPGNTIITLYSTDSLFGQLKF